MDGVIEVSPTTPGGKAIQAALDRAESEVGHTVVSVPASGPDDNQRWRLEEALEIPSYTTLRLEGATLWLADQANCNLIRNGDFQTGNEAVHIEGTAGARLEGNAVNQTRSDLNNTFGIFLYNVDHFSIRGLTVAATENWAITPEHVRDGHISDVHFDLGAEHPNQDGVHVVGPAERIAISDITGRCGDDVIAIDTGHIAHGAGGDVSAIGISNVLSKNSASAGILRTVAEDGRMLSGVYASNLALTGGDAKGDAAIKIGWNGHGLEPPETGAHRDIVIDGCLIESWDGPVCTIQQPVGDLTFQNISATHTGPFLYNEEHDIDRLTIDNCTSRVYGDPPETVLNDYHEALYSGEKWELTDPPHGDVIESPPGILCFDRGRIRDVTVTNSHFELSVPSRDPVHPAWLRCYESLTLDGLYLANNRIHGFPTGVKIDDGATLENVSKDHCLWRGVETPWDGHSIHSG